MTRQDLICKCGGKEFYTVGKVKGGTFVGHAEIINKEIVFLPRRIATWEKAEFDTDTLKCCECDRKI